MSEDHRERATRSTQPADSPSGEQLERDLVARAQRGDTDAFRQLYERLAPVVHRYGIAPIIRDSALAEDILAETFARALEHLGRFEWKRASLAPWLVRIAKNLGLDHLRKHGRLGGWPPDFDALVPDPEQWDAETLTAARETAEVLRERISECLEELNPRYRKVLELRLIEGMPRDQAAQALDVSIGTLDVVLFRACKAFRKVYLRRYGADLDLGFV